MARGKLAAIPAHRPKGTGRQYAYDLLRRSILTLELAPGSMLDEVSMVRQFGVSRTLVREAIISLSSEGLVQLLPNRGARVTGFELDDVRAWHEAIELLHRAVTRWAAIRHRPEHAGAIRRERLAFERAAKANDADEMMEANRRLHLAIADACGNLLVTNQYERLLTLGLRLSRLILSYEANATDVSLAQHIGRIIDQHREMEAAILARDADRAEQLGGSHAQLSLDRSVATLRSSLAGQVAMPTVA
jgi:DNA-binding GntR family transcriptional regulator